MRRSRCCSSWRRPLADLCRLRAGAAAQSTASATDWNGFDPDYHFVGLETSPRSSTDPLFAGCDRQHRDLDGRRPRRCPRCLGLALALLLNRRCAAPASSSRSSTCRSACRAVIVGQIWIWIYQPDWGLLNTGTRPATGVHRFTFAWLAEPATALGSVIVAWSWQQTGLAMVIFLAGLTAIPARSARGRRDRRRHALAADAPHRPAACCARRPSS